jgi:Spy/CpxP family protein refolding chaperone
MRSIKQRAAVAALAAAPAYGGGKGLRGRGGDGQLGPGAAVTRLDNLTTEQREQLQRIRDEARETMTGLREAMRETRAKLRSAVDQDADPETIRALAEIQGDQKAEMTVLRARTRHEVNAVLTEEQRQQLAALRASGRGFGRHPGGMRVFRGNR